MSGPEAPAAGKLFGSPPRPPKPPPQPPADAPAAAPARPLPPADRARSDWIAVG